MNTPRILIVDDRKLRQERDLGKLIDEFKSFPNVDLKTELDGIEHLDAYSIIAVHRTYAVNEKKLVPIIDYIKKNGKYLILFSGGIGERKVEINGHYLTLNSKLFYSQKLIDFLEDLEHSDEIILLKLLYGVKNWKLPLLFRYRHLKWQYAEEKMPEEILDEIEAIEEVLPSEIQHVDQSIQNLLMCM